MNQGAGFSPAQRLRKSHEFLALRKSGKKHHSAHFILLLVRRPGGPSRLGLTVSRKVGGAVQRNRVKRLLREFFRCNQQRLPFAIDLSVIAKPGAAALTYRQIYGELAPLIMPGGQEAA